MKSKLVLVLLSILAAMPSFADETIPYMPVTQPEAAPKVPTVQDTASYYDLSMKGLRQYMRDIRTNDPKTYVTLRPLFSDLERRENQAITGGAFMGFGGAFLTMAGMTFLRKKHIDASGRLTHRVDGAAVGVGVGMVAASFLVYELLSPSTDDLLGFVNEHNSSRPASPLRFTSGILGSGGQAGVTLDF